MVGNILVLESFGAAFPDIYMDASLKVGINLLTHIVVLTLYNVGMVCFHVTTRWAHINTFIRVPQSDFENLQPHGSVLLRMDLFVTRQARNNGFWKLTLIFAARLAASVALFATLSFSCLVAVSRQVLCHKVISESLADKSEQSRRFFFRYFFKLICLVDVPLPVSQLVHWHMSFPCTSQRFLVRISEDP